MRFVNHAALNCKGIVKNVSKLGVCMVFSAVMLGCNKEPEPEKPVPVAKPADTAPPEGKSILDFAGVAPTAPLNPGTLQPTAQAGAPQEKAGSFDPGAVATKEEADEWIAQLNFMVGEYRGTFNKMPPDLDEFVRKGYFKNLPPAPAGKKYFLDPEAKTVVLKDK